MGSAISRNECVVSDGKDAGAVLNDACLALSLAPWFNYIFISIAQELTKDSALKTLEYS